MINATGTIFYSDEYGTIYVSNWSFVTDDILDISSVTSTPYVWGEPPQGYVANGIVYKRGIITTERAILKILDDGYEIVANGISQTIDFIQTTFPCQTKPKDEFKHHLNCAVHDTCGYEVVDGSHWADTDDENAIWAELNSDGSIAAGTVSDNILIWEDVWSG